MHLAAMDGRLAELEVVVEFAPKRIHEISRTKSRDTPLHWAVLGGQEAAVSLLISADADVNAKDKSGDPPSYALTASWSNCSPREQIDLEERIRKLLRDAGDESSY